MPHNTLQSAIAEVRDQLSIDYADENHLDVATGNLGLPRPAFGFTDDLWRAVVKELAIEHKQIRKKFYDVMAILFGPATTWCGSLQVDAAAGDEEVVLNSVDRLPQVGTLIFDEGTASEETLTYHFIDRYTNTVYLDEALAFDHDSYEWDAEQPLTYDIAAGVTDIAVPWSNYFPSTFTSPLTCILSRGQDNEEMVGVTAHSTSTNKFTITSPTNAHFGFVPTVIQTALSSDYPTYSVYLGVDNTSQFPETGYVLLGASSNTFTASAGSTTSVTVAAPSFTGNKLVGYKVKFTGNITAALAGVETFITANSTTVLTFKTIGTAPAVGDTFSLCAVLEYTSNDVDENTLQLRYEIPEELSFAAGTRVELLELRGTLTLATVRSPGTGWDVLQVEPRHIELFIPEAINDPSMLRSASYLHPDESIGDPVAGVSVAANASIGDLELTLTGTAVLPAAGTLIIDSGGANEERVAFGLKWVSTTISSVASVNHYDNLTQTRITVPGPLLVNGLQNEYVFIDGHGYKVYDNTATDIFMVDVLPNHVLDAVVAGTTSLSFFDPEVVTIPHGLASNHIAAEVVDLYLPVHVGTSILDGNLWSTPDVFPGPYVYENETTCVAGSAGPTTTLEQTLAKPTTCVCARSVGMTAVEVDDAASFPLTGFPYNALMGRGTGNRETVNVNDVNLAQRVGNTITLTANVAASPTAPTTLTVLSTVASANNGLLPNATKYRILVGRGTANEEVLMVTATTATTITVEYSNNAHAIGETVELLADVLTVDTLNDDHRGYIDTLWMYSRWPSITSTQRNQAESVEVLYSSITIGDTTGFPDSGTAVFNFGQQRMNVKTTVGGAGLAAGLTALPLTDTTTFPTTYPYKVTLGVGRANQEIVVVTNNNVGTNTFTITHPTKFAHIAVETVAFVTGQSESLEYTSLVAGAPGTLRFSTPVVVQYDHHAGEDVKISLTDSEPRSLGYDFPLRMPPDILFRVGFLFDLIRAAGVKLSVIHKR